MSALQNVQIAQTLLEGLGNGREPAEIAAPFASDLTFEIQGDVGVLPWIGQKRGRAAVADFVRDLRSLTEPMVFDVEDILSSERRVAVVGRLESRIKTTGKITTSQFALILTVSEGIVTRFQMLEDSFDLSNAAR